METPNHRRAITIILICRLIRNHFGILAQVFYCRDDMFDFLAEILEGAPAARPAPDGAPPPVDAPPVDAPPVDAPPVDAPPVAAPQFGRGRRKGFRLSREQTARAASGQNKRRKHEAEARENTLTSAVAPTIAAYTSAAAFAADSAPSGGRTRAYLIGDELVSVVSSGGHDDYDKRCARDRGSVSHASGQATGIAEFIRGPEARPSRHIFSNNILDDASMWVNKRELKMQEPLPCFEKCNKKLQRKGETFTCRSSTWWSICMHHLT